ncbi:uncharacterized protein LOC116782511 [Chiroxiphia lanceolata]|uniref:uncharacterized protein LOC116782511 n=1 Tax=Chiroxiphia lanceolata TaxID=296741 RepID=UPI0013CE8008|nr:uncharacterized protein LOC116782511 [Chiroxiphia lanceolata]
MAWVDLHSAAARGDLDQLRRHWWLNKFHINRRNADKLTPLHLACINGHADVVRFLVGKNCKLNPRDKYKRSPLMLAVQHQHRDCVAVLLEHGANRDHRAATGNTALHFAVLMSSKSLVELLLEHGADIDVKNELGYAPLTLAITERCKGMIEFLLQKGADVNAADNLKRTPLEVAALLQDKDAAEVLLRNGGVINKDGLGAYAVRAFEKLFGDEFIANEGEEYECSERKGQCSARGTEEINISCSGTTADTLSNTSALLELCKTLRYQGGVLPGMREEQKKDKDSSWDSETDSKGQGKVSADPTLPAAVGKSLDARSVAVEHGKGVLPAAGEEQKEDSDSPWDSEVPALEEAVRSCWINGFWAPFPLLLLLPHACTLDLDMPVLQTKCSTDSEGPWDVSKNVLLPAAFGNRLDARALLVRSGKGALPATEEKKEDNDSPWDTEVPALEEAVRSRWINGFWAPFPLLLLLPHACTLDLDMPVLQTKCSTDSKGQGKVMTNLTLRAAVGKSLDARSVAVEHGKGVLPAAAEEQKDNNDFSWDDDDFSWLLETDSKGQGKVMTNLTLRAAVGKSLDARSVAVEHGKGVLPAAGEEQKEDNDSPWDSETDSEGPAESVLLRAAVGKSLDVRSVAVEHGKGVLPAAAEEQKDNNDFSWDDDDFSWLLETDSKGQGKVMTNLTLRAAVGKSLDARSVAVEHGKGVLPAAGEEQKEDNDSPWDSETNSEGPAESVLLRAAVGKSLDARSVAVEHGKGVLPAAAEEQKDNNDFSWDDDDFSWLLETDSKGQGKVMTNLTLRAAVGKSLDARSVAVEHGKGVLPAAGEEQKEDSDSPWDSETDSKGQGKVSADLTLPAGVGKNLDARSVAVEHGKGALPAAEEQKEDSDSPWDSETDSEGPAESVLLPAAVGKSLDARSVAVEHGKGVLPAAGKEQKEDNDSPWDSETDSEGPAESVLLPAAVGKSLDARSVAVEHGKGVLPAAEEEQKDNNDFSWEDDDFTWLLETDSKGRGKVSANLTLRAAVGKSLDVRSVAVEHGKGVLPAAGKEQKEDNDSPWDSETDSEGPAESVLLPAAVGKSLDARSVAVEHGKGVLPAAAEEQKDNNDFSWEDDDFSWLLETDSKAQVKVTADAALPAAVGKSLDARSVAVEHGKGIVPAAGAEQKEYFDPSSKNKVPALEAGDLQLRSDSSRQTDSQLDRQVTLIEAEADIPK